MRKSRQLKIILTTSFVIIAILLLSIIPGKKSNASGIIDKKITPVTLIPKIEVPVATRTTTPVVTTLPPKVVVSPPTTLYVPPTTIPYVAPVTTTTVPAPVSMPVASSDGSYDHRWDAVAICESGGWGRGTGGAYVGDLGITQANWWGNGGTSDTSPAAQSLVGAAIMARYGAPGQVPDQGGCHGGW